MNNLSKLFRYESDGGSLTFDTAGGYIINAPNGIDKLSVNLSKSQGINQVGATIKSVAVQPRAITINGLIYQASQEAKEALVRAVRPDVEGRLYAGDYYIDVYPTATPTIGCREYFAPFQFSLLAAYPYWTSTSSKTYVLSGIEPLFKFPWNVYRAYRFGQNISASYINARNDGTVPAPLICTLTALGSVVNPKILNIETGEYLQLNHTLVEDESVTITFTHSRTTVVSTVDGDIRGALTLDSGLRRLAVGNNFLKPSATSGADLLGIQIEYSAEMAGIIL